MFSTCLCWFLRLLGYVISVYLPSFSSVLLGSLPGTYNVILCLSVCMSFMLVLVWVLTYVWALCVYPMCMFLLFPSLAISWDLWSRYFVFGVPWWITAIYLKHGRHMCYPVREAPVNRAVLCCFHQYSCLGIGSPVDSFVAQDQLFWCSSPTQPWPPFS